MEFGSCFVWIHHGDVAGVMGVGEFQGWDAEEKGLVASFIMHFVDDVARVEYKIFSKCVRIRLSCSELIFSFQIFGCQGMWHLVYIFSLIL